MIRNILLVQASDWKITWLLRQVIGIDLFDLGK
jgi:hypothetical protein